MAQFYKSYNCFDAYKSGEEFCLYYGDTLIGVFTDARVMRKYCENFNYDVFMRFEI